MRATGREIGATPTATGQQEGAGNRMRATGRELGVPATGESVRHNPTTLELQQGFNNSQIQIARQLILSLVSYVIIHNTLSAHQ